MGHVITRPEWEPAYYQTSEGRPHKITGETEAEEAAKVAYALRELHRLGLLDGHDYDPKPFALLRTAVRQHFEIPWTSITPPMERLLYALGAVQRPRVVVAMGIFCGNTLVWNVGAAAGPGKVYDAERLVGVEVEPGSVELARRNFEHIGAAGVEILREDGHDTLARFHGSIELLYLDASGSGKEADPRRRGKSIYTTLLEAACDRLAPGALVIAHDTIPAWFPKQAQAYLDAVRDPRRFRASAEVRIDEQGVEITRK
jgi:predicted O-methyltransferase YrrM